MNEQDRAFLGDEYLKLQDQYEDYDRRSLTIKGWMSAGAAIAIASGLSKDAPGTPLWVALAALAACFWYLEAKWKMFQYATRGRLEEIEAYFRGEGDELVPMQIYSRWFHHYQSGTVRFWPAALQGFVMLPYVLIIAICAAGILRSLPFGS